MLALPVSALAETTVSGTIEGYGCGDNCYLTIVSEAGELVTGLCAAPECMQWNAQAAMPDSLIGSQVRLTLGTGRRLDGQGNVMGDFPAFTDMVFDN